MSSLSTPHPFLSLGIPSKTAYLASWEGAWGRGSPELEGDVMVETRLQGTTQAATPPFITPGDTSVDPWLERVQKALPDLKVRSQQALARLAQSDWPELAHALVLAEKDRKCRLL